MNTKPTFIHRDGMTDNKDYTMWLSEVKGRFRKCQIKAAVRVNTSMLEFYWSIGRDLVMLKAEQKWGAGVTKQFSLDMRREFPNETGFSYTNVKSMKRWYLFYSERFTKGYHAGDFLEIKGYQAGDFLEMPEAFGLVPWRHHVHIVSKSDTLEEALFYLNEVVDGNWSRSMLEDNMAKGLYKSKGNAITNFSKKLPTSQGKLAQEILKDPYSFDFLTMKEGYDEKELEEALVTNITHFLLELGSGFAFVGRQKELRMPDGTSFFPDLLFYHIPQKRYVVIELKAVKYTPEFAGKINFYVTAIDKLMRGENDNPTVGLIICKAYDKTIVEWSLQDISKPLGVATYQLQEVVDRTVTELEMKNSK